MSWIPLKANPSLVMILQITSTIIPVTEHATSLNDFIISGLSVVTFGHDTGDWARGEVEGEYLANSSVAKKSNIGYYHAEAQKDLSSTCKK